MAKEVFVSHSVKDKESAQAVVSGLEAANVSCWIAPRDVLPGADWGESILNAIEAARIMILIFSRNANSSSQIKREVERAVNKDTYIIPFRLDETAPTRSLEYFISTSQWMDAFPPPLEKHLDRLLSTVNAVLGKPPPKPEPDLIKPGDATGTHSSPLSGLNPVSPPESEPRVDDSGWVPPVEQAQVTLGMATYFHQVPMPSAQGPTFGMRIAVPVSVARAKNKTLQVITKFSYANGPPLWANAQESLYRDTGGLIATGTAPRVLSGDNEPFSEQSMMIPYYALNFQPTNGFAAYNLAFTVFAFLDNQLVAQTPPVFFAFRW